MRPTAFLILGLVLLGAPTGAQGHHAAPDRDTFTLEDAGRLFKGSCSQCHTVPDTAFETDRAWLEQVRDTA